MNILVTGGAGYIGSHVVYSLLESDIEKNIIVIDNLSNSNVINLQNIEKFLNKKIIFINCDLKDKLKLNEVFKNYDFDFIFHFAGLKSVPESFMNTDSYYKNNVIGTNNLLEAMLNNNVSKLIFSSSASVYGLDCKNPILEEHKTHPGSPYAQNKLDVENNIAKLCKSENLDCISLRYFNPIGFNYSVPISEFSNLKSTNIVSNILNVITGRSNLFKINGDDYPTIDGTCIRDYIHIEDLVSAHLLSIPYLKNNKGFNIFNIGTGIGYSVKQLLDTFEKIIGNKIPTKIVKRREGDPPEIYCDPRKAKLLLNWESNKNLVDMCKNVISYTNLIYEKKPN